MWNDLSMADRAKYIKLGVRNGITDLSIIKDTYNTLHKETIGSNKYSGGGLLSAEQLLQKVDALGHKAYINKNRQLVTMAGTPLVYNYDQDRFEFKNSHGVPMWLDKDGKFLRYNPNNTKVQEDNESLKQYLDYPSIYQTILEDEAFVKNRAGLDKQKRVPYIDSLEKVITDGISKGVPISSNLVDSVQYNLPARSDQLDAAGLFSRETNAGKYPAYTIKTPGENADFSTFKRRKGATPSDLMNNHNYFISPVRGALNALFPFIPEWDRSYTYGHPESYYLPDIITDSDSKGLLEKAEEDLRYQRRRGKFDPTEKVIKKNKEGKVLDYYNPEDNPWIHAVQNLQDRDYGMGPSYTEQVRKDSKDLEYLFGNKDKSSTSHKFKGGGQKPRAYGRPYFSLPK